MESSETRGAVTDGHLSEALGDQTARHRREEGGERGTSQSGDVDGPERDSGRRRQKQWPVLGGFRRL